MPNPPFIRFVRFVFAPLRNRRFLPLNFGCIFFLMMMMGPHNIQYACHLIFFIFAGQFVNNFCRKDGGLYFRMSSSLDVVGKLAAP